MYGFLYNRYKFHEKFEVGELWPDLNLITLKPSSWLEWRSEEGGGREIPRNRQQPTTVAL